MLQHNWPNEESRNIKEVESSAFGWNWQAGRQLFFNGFLCFLLRHYFGNMSGSWLHQHPHSLECSQTAKKTNRTPPKMVFLKCFVFSPWNESSKNSAEEILGHFNTPAVIQVQFLFSLDPLILWLRMICGYFWFTKYQRKVEESKNLRYKMLKQWDRTLFLRAMSMKFCPATHGGHIMSRKQDVQNFFP